MSEQVPEIQEMIDRQRAENPASRREGEEELSPPADLGHRWSWVLIAGSVVGLGVLAAAQAWFFQRPRSMVWFTVLFPVVTVILSALLVAGVVGIVVSIQLRQHRHRTGRVSEIEGLVRLRSEGVIDDETLVRVLRDHVL